jgi:alkanesulfonate monooxygenase SsuD/methylene tetrahydromethanopterin reductase-like flavin-dependent oxidoreductase (luciferase family)
LLQEAIATYRRQFQPSEQLNHPYVFAGVNVLAADTVAEAQDQLLTVSRTRVALIFGGNRCYSDEEADMIFSSPQGQRSRR